MQFFNTGLICKKKIFKKCDKNTSYIPFITSRKGKRYEKNTTCILKRPDRTELPPLRTVFSKERLFTPTALE